ncbi:MAG: hypothetical protein JXA30_00580 [Deltaproteobacteria bacterium]|nr:hypothetical protein [Deltaproteobacteria bacterium]
MCTFLKLLRIEIVAIFVALLLLCFAYACGDASSDGKTSDAGKENGGGTIGPAGVSGSRDSSGSGGTAKPIPDAEVPPEAGDAADQGGSSGIDGSGGTSGVSGAGGESGEGGTSGSSGTDGGTGGDGGDSECRGGSQIDFSLVGWATENGTTTGGKNGTTTTVVNGEQLAQALKDKSDSDTPLTILVDGTITAANSGDVEKFDVKDVRDVSIIGTGSGADFEGIGIKIFKASNIIFRNLRVFKVDIGDKDAISIEGPADHIWIDHCELYAEYQNVNKEYYDGLLDAKAEAEYITYSWNYLHDSWKTSLVGSGESDTYDRKITIHHNYYRNCYSRLPLFRSGNGHIFNNYYVDIASTGINSRINACLRIENNYFSNVANPWVSAFSDVLGGVELVCNTVTDGSRFNYSSNDVNEPLACEADIPYDYSSVLNHVDQVSSVVVENAGVGKLADPTDY